MRLILPLLVAVMMLGLVSPTHAQQEAQYSNFMFNRIALNPAVVGSREALSISAVYRQQWLGFEGAPNTQMLNGHTPMLNNSVGLGLSLSRDQIGLTNSYDASIAYAYRFPVSNGTLAMGLQGSLKAQNIDWENADATQLNDPNIPAGTRSVVVPNFGAGVYWQSKRFYLGLSIPRLLNSSLDFTATTSDLYISRERRHLYAMGGMMLPINSRIMFTPNILLKHVDNAPFDADLNLSFLFFEALTLGATYRLGDAVNFIAHYQFSPRLRFGIAYDYTLSGLQNTNSGSVEAIFGYDFVKDYSKIVHPRFF